jgi:hypothetical protein
MHLLSKMQKIYLDKKCGEELNASKLNFARHETISAYRAMADQHNESAAEIEDTLSKEAKQSN